MSNDPIRPVESEAFSVLRSFFDYDLGVPFDERTVEVLEEPAYHREKFVFRGPRDSRVPGYLALPCSSSPPHPCVMLLHGIGGSKEGWWTDGSSHSGYLLTLRLLEAGYAVVTLDCQYHGERLGENDYESPAAFLFERGWFERAREMIVQSVVEHRRCLDLMATRPEIDESRIGVAGYSMGGLLSFLMPALDPRISVAVSCVPPIVNAPTAISAYHYAPRVLQPHLLLVAEEDPVNYTADTARHLHSLLHSSEKDIHFYPGGHNLPADWIDKAIDWIQRHLSKP